MIDVLFLVLPDTLLLDLVGPAEALRLANQQLQARGKPPVGADPSAPPSSRKVTAGVTA